MRRLFIIGNGFDRAHDLPTTYEHFHAFLHASYPDATEDDIGVPSCITGNHGEDVYDPDEVVGFLMRVISQAEGREWSELEDSLGKLDFNDEFEWLPSQYDRDGERNPWHEAYNNEDVASQILGCFKCFPALFSEWVKSLCISLVEPRPGFVRLIDRDSDLFLSFNYTWVLEQIYRVRSSNVCHIHGVQGLDEAFVFGHGEGPLFDDGYNSLYIGSEDGLESVQDLLRKDTDSAIQKHQAFFDRLTSEISAIYIYGFSCGKADEPYLREIFDCVNTVDVVCYLNSFDRKKHEEMKKTICRCGFKGCFDTYSA